MWAKEQGGRHTPTFDGYKPGFRASTDGHGDVDLGVAEVKLPACLLYTSDAADE